MNLDRKEKHTFDDLQRLDNITALKLLMYMNEYIDKYNVRKLRHKYGHEDLLNADFDYAFNLWLSLDYVNNQGQSMIDSMIKDKMRDLTSEEINLLMMKRESYLSIYRVEKSLGNMIYLEDLFLEEQICFVKTENMPEINIGDYFAGRLIWYRDQVLNIGQYKKISEECIEAMIYSIEQKYKFFLENVEMYSKRYYLKRHSFAIYSVIFEIEDQFLKRKQDLKVEAELKSFRFYLAINRNLSEQTIKKYDANLRDFYKHTLRKYYRTLNQITEEVIYEYLIYVCINQKISIGQLRSTLVSMRHYIRHIEILNIGDANYDSLLELCKERNYFGEIYANIGAHGNDIQLSYIENKETVWNDEWAMPVVKRLVDTPSLILDLEKFVIKVSNGKYSYKSRKFDIELIDDYEKAKRYVIYENFCKKMDWIRVNYDDKVSFDKNKFDLFMKKSVGTKIIEFVMFLWFDFNWEKLSMSSNSYDPLEYSERHRYLEHLLELPVGHEKDFDQWRLGMNKDEYKFVKTGFKIYKSKIFIPFILGCFSDLGLVELGERKDNIAIEWLHGLNIQTISLTRLGREMLYYLMLKERHIDSEKKIVYLDS